MTEARIGRTRSGGRPDRSRGCSTTNRTGRKSSAPSPCLSAFGGYSGRRRRQCPGRWVVGHRARVTWSLPAARRRSPRPSRDRPRAGSRALVLRGATAGPPRRVRGSRRRGSAGSRRNRLEHRLRNLFGSRRSPDVGSGRAIRQDRLHYGIKPLGGAGVPQRFHHQGSREHGGHRVGHILPRQRRR